MNAAFPPQLSSVIPGSRDVPSSVPWGLCLVLAMFWGTGVITWNQPNSSIEYNRNDAAFYQVLGHNLAQHGVYSHATNPPYSPHTEWPPGIPLLYALPLTFAGSGPLAEVRGLLHLWTLLISTVALIAVYRYVRRFESQFFATTVTACVAAAKAFLDSAHATTADTASIAVAFLLLDEMHQQFANDSQRPVWRQVLFFVGLSLAPLVKPYLGMLFVPVLWHYLCSRNLRTIFRGGLILAACCVPFAGFLIYSQWAAHTIGTISAIDWLTSSNPVQTREGIATEHRKTLVDWMVAGKETLQYHLVYNVVQSAVPLLEWWPLRGQSPLWRYGLLAVLGSSVLIGAWQLRRKSLPLLLYAAATFAFFVIFACDSPRYFTVLMPVMAWMTLAALPRRGEHSGLVACTLLAVISGGAWANHRSQCRHDPDPVFNAIYAALEEIRHDDSIDVLAVPFHVREITWIETGKTVVPLQTWAEHARNPRAAQLLVHAPQHPIVARWMNESESTVDWGAGQSVVGECDVVRLLRGGAVSVAAGAPSVPEKAVP